MNHRVATLMCGLLGAGLLAGADVVGAGEPPPPQAPSAAELPTFDDVTEKAGIRFKHSFGDHHLSNIVEGTGPGGTFFDYDSDGDQDIYLVNGCWLRDVNDNLGRDLRGKLFNALYQNDGDGTFTDVTKETGAGDDGYGMGAAAADYDGDGHLDLYVLNYGPNVLYRNGGDGRFSDVTEKSGLGDPSWSVSASWLDYDRDGDLDVYVANYLEYDGGKFRSYYPAAGYPGPLSYKAQHDRLFRNDGEGRFTDVTAEAGIEDPDGRAMSSVAVDLNDDGLVDLYVTNDASPNWHFVNLGGGRFRNDAMLLGTAFGEGGQGASSMGPSIGDVDRDGRLDILVPDMAYGCLLLNEDEIFVDVTAQSNLAVICGQYTGWGGLLMDYDNDGYLDVFTSNGDAHHEYRQEAVLARNDGKGKFVDVARRSGDYFGRKFVGRGAASADFDDDGDMDILVLVLNDSPVLLRNDGGNRNGWLRVIPRTPRSRHAVLGARVTVTAGKLVQAQEVLGMSGYLSQSDPRPLFGLGEASRADRVEVRWPSGKRTVLQDVPANRTIEVIEKVE